jgi:hypothetical protein
MWNDISISQQSGFSLYHKQPLVSQGKIDRKLSSLELVLLFFSHVLTRQMGQKSLISGPLADSLVPVQVENKSNG